MGDHPEPGDDHHKCQPDQNAADPRRSDPEHGNLPQTFDDQQDEAPDHGRSVVGNDPHRCRMCGDDQHAFRRREGVTATSQHDGDHDERDQERADEERSHPINPAFAMVAPPAADGPLILPLVEDPAGKELVEDLVPVGGRRGRLLPGGEDGRRVVSRFVSRVRHPERRSGHRAMINAHAGPTGHDHEGNREREPGQQRAGRERPRTKPEDHQRGQCGQDDEKTLERPRIREQGESTPETQ